MNFVEILTQNKNINVGDIKSENDPVATSKIGNNLIFTFYPKKTILEVGDGRFEIGYNEYSELSIEIKGNDNGVKATVNFKGKMHTAQLPSTENINSYKEDFNSIVDAFSFDSDDHSPAAAVQSLAESVGLVCDGRFNPLLYELIVRYSNIFFTIRDNDAFEKGSTLKLLVIENTAKLTDNIGKTLGKSFNLGNIGGSLFNIAKAAGTRVLKSVTNDFLDANGLLALTDKNVILAKQNRAETFDFDDAWDMIEAQEDDTIADALDIFYQGEKFLDNVARKYWSEYQNFMRKLRKGQNETAQFLLDSDSAVQDDEDDELERELLKLKKLLDKGLISQDEYDKKKSQVLGL